MATDEEMTFTKYDTAEYLKTPEDMAEYLLACFEEAPDDIGFLTYAIGTVARAHGMTQLAKDVGVSRESLCKSLDKDGNPSFSTVIKVLHAMGLTLVPAVAKAA